LIFVPVPTSILLDQTGYPVTLSGVPKRIISLVPSQTELLHQLGLETETVGITRFCIEPDAWYRTKTRVGGTKQVNHEIIRELSPDLIIGNKEENSQADIEALRALYPVWLSDVITIGDAVSMIRQIGGMTGKGIEAEMLSSAIEGAYSGLQFSERSKSPLRVAYLIWNEPLMAAGAGTFIHSMMQCCGWINCFGNKDRYPVVTEAELREQAPDVILLSTEPYPFNREHCQRLSGTLGIRTELVDGEAFSWYGPRMLQSFDQLTELDTAFRRPSKG
jgi:ABC-type Fe3+-hydroxamate transport system substrate-binding protein